MTTQTEQTMRIVIIESPYASNGLRTVSEHEAYARACLRDSLGRGEAPLASHLLYTQPGVLDDLDPIERQWGIDAGLVWATKADATVVYLDFGLSSGMRYGIEHAERCCRPIEYRLVGDEYRHVGDAAIYATRASRISELSALRKKPNLDRHDIARLFAEIDALSKTGHNE